MRQGLLAICATLAVVLSLSASATADFSSTHYSFKGDNCGARVDPITLVLYGADRGDYPESRYVLQAKTGWSGDNSTDQWAGSHGYCTPMDGESYDNCALCNRKHVRFNQTHHRDLKDRWETVGTPHEEKITTCGHVTFSYVSARNAIINAMNPPYSWSYQNWGNTAGMTQCDGSVMSSDGYVAWIYIG